MTFEAITRRRVITDQYARGANADIEHISLASSIGLLLVAPATANIIGKFANGIADDFLTSLYLATRAPVMMAAAMNTNMLEHESVQRNMATLTARGVQFVDPGDGYLACGWIGKGRLAEPEAIAEAAHRLLQPRGSLLGRFVLVTAGPTYEDIDAVRYVGNRSSGKMGYAVAAEAARRGARVVLVSGPSREPVPAGVEVVRVRRALEMHLAVGQHAGDADIVVMAAAVADYMPEGGGAPGKIEKTDGPLRLTLVRTPDILAELGAARKGGHRPVLIGFAAESGDPVARGRAKLTRKARGSHRRQRRLAGRSRLRLRPQCRDPHRPRRRGDLLDWSQDRARRAVSSTAPSGFSSPYPTESNDTRGPSRSCRTSPLL